MMGSPLFRRGPELYTLATQREMELACMRGTGRKFNLGFICVAGIQTKTGLPGHFRQYNVC
jgi:hypothetical protein